MLTFIPLIEPSKIHHQCVKISPMVFKLQAILISKRTEIALKVKGEMSLQQHCDTDSYQVTSLSDQQLFSYCADKQTH